MLLDMTKKKIKKKVEELIESQKGSLNKFVISNKQNINDNLFEKHINEQEIHEKELEDNEIIQQKNDIENNDSNVQLCNITTFDEEVKENLEENKKGKIHITPSNYCSIVNVPPKLPIVSMSPPKLPKNVNISLMTKMPFIKLLKKN
jgi:lipopolysaccharide export LptBFGC system permease protein LptF